MTYEENLESISVPVHANYSAKQYRFVTVNSSGRAALTGAGEKADGVLQTDPNAQDAAGAVAIQGVTRIVAGGEIPSKGLPLTSDGNGEAVVAGTGDAINAVSMEIASVGNITSALLKVQGGGVK